MDNDPYDDTIPVRVVVTPTLLIPVVTIRRKRKREWRMRAVLVAIILTWLMLLAVSAYLAWVIIAYAHGGFN